MLKKALQILLIALPVTFAELWLLDFGVRLPTVEVVAQTVDQRKLEADRLFEEGKKQFSNSQFEEALQLWQQALVIYREIGYRQGEADSLGNLGAAYERLAEYEQAIGFFERSLAIAREIGYRQGEIKSLGSLGAAYERLAEHKRAIEFHEQSLAIFREIGDRQGQANSLDNLGNAYLCRLAEYERAINFFEQSLAIFREIGDRQGQANSLGSLGGAYGSLAEYEQAIDFSQQSLAIFRKIGNRQGEANSLGNLGTTYYRLAEYEQAIDFYEQSLAISREIGDRQRVVKSLGNLGHAHYSLAEYEQAIDFYKQSLAIAREIGNRQGEANSLGNLGNVYGSLAEYEQAIDFFEQSLAISREIGYRQGQAASLNNLGNAYDSLAEYEQAIDFFEQSLAISREIGYRQGQAASLNNLGNAYGNFAEYERAIDFHEQSLAIAREIGYRQGNACSLCNLGNAYGSLVEYERAIDFFEQSLAIAREIGNLHLEALSLGNLGAALKKSSNFTEAEPYLYNSINIYEEIRTKISSNNDPWKVSIFETQTNPYITLQQVLIALKKPQKSLLISERGRAQALVDLLLKKQSLTPQPPNLQEIHKIAQEQNATLVEYSVIPNSELYIWVIPPDGDIQFRTVNLPQDIALQQLVKVSREQIGIRGRGNNNATPQTNDATNHLQQLHQLLIAPIADLLPENEEERIIFIPHRELFLVPFAALQDQNTYLIEKHTILTAPSIQSLSLTRKHRQRVKNLPGEALVVGNPTMPKFKNLSPLPGAETEAKKIAQMLNTEPLLGAQATEKTIVEKLPKAKIIHLATHGLLDDISGVGSPGAIALAPFGKDDGFLTSREIMEKFGLTNTTPLQAELVVLSACDTGRGDIKGEGVVGLSRSLIAAGVPSLVVSLWKVPDHATQELIVEFYTNLYERKLDKAQALRQAMLTMLEGGENPDPLDWAAFTVIGEAE
ncbi:MAG: tetratricopeptide repeat protein [Symploca sp. SIO1B1]|nr:tetratricopeptide repeat protein [Symploca sp. SIO1B1]